MTQATKAWRASLDRGRGSVDFGGPSRKGSIDLGAVGGYEAMARPSFDAGAAPAAKPANDPGRAGEHHPECDRCRVFAPVARSLCCPCCLASARP